MQARSKLTDEALHCSSVLRTLQQVLWAEHLGRLFPSEIVHKHSTSLLLGVCSVCPSSSHSDAGHGPLETTVQALSVLRERRTTEGGQDLWYCID